MSSEKGNASAHDQFKKTRLLSEDTRRASDLQNLPDYIRRLKLENMVFQSLHMLRQSQETEFKLAQEKLFAQKDFVLSIFRQLEGTFLVRDGSVRCMVTLSVLQMLDSAIK